MRSFQSECGIVGHHMGRSMVGLAECGSDDAVVCLVRVEPMLVQKVLLDAIDLDMNRRVV